MVDRVAFNLQEASLLNLPCVDVYAMTRWALWWQGQGTALKRKAEQERAVEFRGEVIVILLPVGKDSVAWRGTQIIMQALCSLSNKQT